MIASITASLTRARIVPDPILIAATSAISWDDVTGLNNTPFRTFEKPDFSGAIGEEWTSTDFLGNVTRMAPGIELNTNSGMLSVTIDPRPHWLVGLATLTVDLIFVGILYHFWSAIPVWVRVFWIFVLVPGLWRSLYEFFGEEIVEFDSQTLTVRKGIHGWERKHEYPVNECSELEWQPGNNGHSYLTCKVGRWPKTFGNGLSENEGIEILAALQQTLPDVAQKICSYPSYREHFITLGLKGK